MAAACLGLAAYVVAPAVALAQAESLPQALDHAGSAANRALGEMLGLTPAKPARKRRSPARAVTPPAPGSAAAAKAGTSKTESSKTETSKTEASRTEASKTEASRAETPKTGTPKAGAPASAPPGASAARVPLPPAAPLPRAAALESKPAGAPPRPRAAPAPEVAAPAKATEPAKTVPRAKRAAPVKTAAPVVAATPAPRPVEAPGNGEPATAPSAPAEAGVAAPRPAPAEAASQRTALANVPLPPQRPALATPAALPAPADAAEPAAEPDLPSLRPPQAPGLAAGCPELASADIAVFAVADPPPEKGACGIERPVRLAAVRMTDGHLVPLEPAALLRCDMAVEVAHWLREEVGPTVATLGSPLDKVMVAASYGCRPRNRVAGAKMSEHGRGNALDTRGYKLEDGRTVVVGGKGGEAMPVAFQERLKASACGRFKTILGPGSDGYHEQHFHVDLQPRRSSRALCHWVVRDIEPAARPAEAPAQASPAPDSPAQNARQVPAQGSAEAPPTASTTTKQ